MCPVCSAGCRGPRMLVVTVLEEASEEMNPDGGLG